MTTSSLSMRVVFRIISAAMTGVFAVAVAVQYNDPDPFRWMMIYGAAGVLSAWVVLRGGAPLPLAVIVGLVALVAGLAVAGVSDWTAFREMFLAWEMKSSTIEQAREASGLLIVAGWMAVLTIEAWRVRRR